MSEFIDYSGYIESVETWDGGRCDMTVEVMVDEELGEHPELIALGGDGSGWQLTVMQAEMLMESLQQAIHTAKFNSDRM